MNAFNPTLYDPSNIDEGENSFEEETPHLIRVTLATFGLFGIPQRFADIGCGMGQTVEVARKLGVDAKGVELYPRPGLIQHDLRLPLSKLWPEGADMLFCWEVGEHLPKESDDVFAESLRQNLTLGGLLIFTAAIPGQAGLGHINTKIPWEWADIFSRHNLNRVVQATAALAFLWEFSAGPAMYHLRQNLQVFS